MTQKIARIYIRVSTDQQDTARQEALIDQAKGKGYYIAGVYSEKASGAKADRPELQRLLADLQPGDVLIAEKLDRLTRLPLAQADQLLAAIKAKGARLAIPDVLDLSEVISATENETARIVLDAMQAMLLRIALQAARDDYETRRRRQAEGIAVAKTMGRRFGKRPNEPLHQRIIALRQEGYSKNKTAELLETSPTTVARVWREHKELTAKI